MQKIFCDDCDKPLDDAKSAIIVQEIIFIDPPPGRPRGQKGLHFCDHKCMNSWVVKAANRPSIIVPENRPVGMEIVK